MVNQEQWKKDYEALGFGAAIKDADVLMDKLNKAALKDFIECHEKVKAWTGLDMRQNYMMIDAKVRLEYIIRTEEQAAEKLHPTTMKRD